MTAASIADTDGGGEVPSRRRFFSACAVGVLPAAILFVWILTAGTWEILARHPTADFYDAQARSLLDGRLDVPADVLGIEGFLSDGRTYMYQGPFPAFLRLPIAALSEDLDGRLTGLSMLVAFVAAAGAASTLLWQVRRLLRDTTPVGMGEAIATTGYVFACMAGSLLLFQASQVSVYHESALWGAALALATLSALIRHLRAPGRGTLAAASSLVAATLCSRASVGMGMVGALAVILLIQVVTALQMHRRGAISPGMLAVGGRTLPSGRALARTTMAVVLPLLLYSGINIAKFGTPLSVPWERQVFTRVSSQRQDFLRQNSGTFLGTQFVPSTALAYLRPDAISLHDRFPWVGFREDSIGRSEGFGGVRFDKIDAAGSIPVSYPLLGGVAVVGLAAVVRARRSTGALLSITAPLAGATAAATTIFGFGFIAHRYLVDVLPLMILASAAGLATITRWTESHPGRTRVTLVSALVLLGAWGTWVTIAQSLWYQSVYASPGDERTAARFYDRRQTLPRLPRGQSQVVRQGPDLPKTGGAGELFVVGDCAGVYVSDGSRPDELTHTSWKAVARGEAVGAHALEVVFPTDTVGTSDPLLSGGTRQRPEVISVEYLGDGELRFRYRGAGGDVVGRRVGVKPGGRHRLEVVADAQIDLLFVTLDDRRVLDAIYPGGTLLALGANEVDTSTHPQFRGLIKGRTPSDALCRRLLGSAGHG